MIGAGYTKLFGSIIASTIWREDKETKIVWITLLAMANKNGLVETSVPGLADLARVTLPECEKALKVLLSPDEYSRSREHDGRRIEAKEGGFLILNFVKYRNKLGPEDRREYLRLKQQEHRAKKKGGCQQRVDMSTTSTQSESESESKSQSESEPLEGGKPPLANEELSKARSKASRFLDLWCDAHFKDLKEKAVRPKSPPAELVNLCSQFEPEELMAVARKAWAFRSGKAFSWCSTHSRAVKEFASRFENIRAELAVDKPRSALDGNNQPLRGNF